MSTKVSISKFDSLKGNEEFIGGKFKRYEEDISAIKEKLREVIEKSVGSIDKLIKNGDRVLIKPNLAFFGTTRKFFCSRSTGN